MEIINQLNHKRAKAAFRSLGYSQKDYIHFNVLADAMDTINHQQFDKDIFEQLWQQCKLNSQGQIKIDNFIDTIIRAEAILIQKQRQIQISLMALQKKKNFSEIKTEEKMLIQEKIRQQEQMRSGFALDLEILRKPFRNFALQTIYPSGDIHHYDGSVLGTQLRDSQMEQTAFIPISNKKNLMWIGYLTFILACLEFLVGLNITTFMNTVLFLLIFSLYLFEHFDRSTIRLLFWSTIFTLIVDVLWYIVIAGSLWSPAQIGIWPQFMSGYLKFSVVLISIIFIGKLFLVMLLCSEYNIDESRPQQVKLLSHTFKLSSKTENAPLKKIIEEYLPKKKQLNQGYARSGSPSKIK